jgi:hypothetical protein
VDINPVASRKLPVPEARLVSAATEKVAAMRSVEVAASAGGARHSLEEAIAKAERVPDRAIARIEEEVAEVDKVSYELLTTISTKVGGPFGPKHSYI